ncbi:LysR family transcriptional regulator [Mailhella sp.]|uniref:LysR family transcriptional regulator n=1 Tax=Mailhella sp. TaxID=1981029 RepID=UPI003AB2288B
MKIDHLLSFRKVAQTGSFTRAAQELFITQPTVTHHIQQLEYELGCSLLIRSNQDTRLTPEGEELLVKVGELFRLLEEIKGIASRKKVISGELKLAASSVMGTYFLPPLLKIFSDKYADIDINLKFGNSYAIATWVQDGFVDVGFAPWVPGFTSLVFDKATAEPCVLVASPAYCEAHRDALRNLDFSAVRFILREKGTRVHELAMGWMKRLGRMDAPTPLITGDMESSKNLVLSGVGVAIIPRCCVEQSLCVGSMEEIKLPESLRMPAVEYFVVRRKNEKAEPISELLLSELNERYGIRLQKNGRLGTESSS